MGFLNLFKSDKDNLFGSVFFGFMLFVFSVLLVFFSILRMSWPSTALVYVILTLSVMFWNHILTLHCNSYDLCNLKLD